MKRTAIVIGIVVGIAATPALVAASDGSQARANPDRYELASTWNTPLGQVYGPVQVTPSSYGFLSK